LKDYYKILGINKKDSCEHIKDVYWHLYQKFDPELNKRDAYAIEEITEIEEAYLCLSDKSKRGEYDYWYENGIAPIKITPSKYHWAVTWKMGITFFLIGCLLAVLLPIVPAYTENPQGMIIDTLTGGHILTLFMLPSLLAVFRRSSYQAIIIITNHLLIIAIMISLFSIVIWFGLLPMAFLNNRYNASQVPPDETKSQIKE
jgi:hypothetical protein